MKKSIVGKPDDEGRSKKAYDTPKLEIFGDLGDITKGVGKFGGPDNVKKPKGTALE